MSVMTPPVHVKFARHVYAAASGSMSATQENSGGSPLFPTMCPGMRSVPAAGIVFIHKCGNSHN